MSKEAKLVAHISCYCNTHVSNPCARNVRSKCYSLPLQCTNK